MLVFGHKKCEESLRAYLCAVRFVAGVNPRWQILLLMLCSVWFPSSEKGSRVKLG
ncbi:hypothetical protein HMPREF9999_00283 [Alloprevotella sp. oral taxon 473 str. F0040]|nr:hypothetical protein HMPREF9999_00283 [Alloprevotella sp. oral taxon 473 str. F0040]